MFDTFNLLAEIRRFEILKMLYPPKGRLPADSSRGPIVFTYVLSPEGTAKAVPKVVQLFLLMFYFGLGNVYWTFRFRAGNPPF